MTAFSGRRPTGPNARRSDPKAAPGSLLGPKRVDCLRCGAGVDEDKAMARPPGAQPGQARFFLCPGCAGQEVRPEGEAGK